MNDTNKSPWVRILAWSSVATILLALSVFWPVTAELFYFNGSAIRFLDQLGDFYSLKNPAILFIVIFDSLLNFGLMVFVLFRQQSPHPVPAIVSVFFGVWVNILMIFNNFTFFAYTPASTNIIGIFSALAPLIAASVGIILGAIFGIISLFYKGHPKWLGLTGLLLNLLSIVLPIIFSLLIPEGFLN